MNAVARSQYWNSTAIFVTYDEGGGFWDHVAPPYASGYGTRTPMIIVSPYARRGRVSPADHQCVDPVVHAEAVGPAAADELNTRQNNLMSAFDFSQAPSPAPLPMRRRTRSASTAPAAS